MAQNTTNYGFPYPEDADPVDVAGDIQALAEDIDINLGEIIADTVGTMVTSNTENGISVTYDDADNTLDFDVEDFDITLLGDVSGSASIVNLASASVNVTVIDDSHNHSSSTITDFSEAVADTVGNMVNSNTENGISVTYDDNDNTLDFDVDDFDIVLSGDVSGSATVTNLANVNISASVADNSHNHVAANITDFETAVDSVVDSFANIDVPTGTDPAATAYNDTLYITESNGVLVNGAGSNTIDISTNATPLNTASAIVSRDSEKTFDITGIDFDTSTSATTQVGRLAWDDGEGTLKVNLKGGNVDLDIGQENVVLCYNGSGSAMSIGDVVYIQGAQGQRPDITLASASSESSSKKTLGIVAEAIGAGNEGFVTTFGVVKGVNTFGFTEGAALWLSTAAGEFTQTPPTTPDHLVFVGYCLKASSSTGRIFVEPQNGYEIEELHNVLITSASANDVLIYNSASSLWMNESFDERAQDAIATMISNGTQTNLTIDYDDNANSLSFNVVGAVADVQGTTNEIEVTSASNIYTVGLPDDVTISNDLTVVGNLTVSGSVAYVNTTELLIEDNIVTLNSSASAPLLDAGIEVQRGSASNVYIKWDESSDVWQFTNDGSTYYDLVDFDTTLATKTTDDLTEGSTNLYFTNTRALDATEATIASASAAAVLSASAYTDSEIAALTTDDLTEGSNEYFTVERAQDAAASMITGGSHTNITVTYNDGTNTLDLTGSATVTNEQVQDAIAPLFTHSNHTNITATYDDANDEILLQASGGGASLGSGSAYPTSSITNGDLFYNTTRGRTAIYFDTIWKEFAYVTDFPSDGGTPSTTTFADSYDGGDPSTSIFVGALDGGSL
jgi:hypothetical protein